LSNSDIWRKTEDIFGYAPILDNMNDLSSGLSQKRKINKEQSSAENEPFLSSIGGLESQNDFPFLQHDENLFTFFPGSGVEEASDEENVYNNGGQTPSMGGKLLRSEHWRKRKRLMVRKT